MAAAQSNAEALAVTSSAHQLAFSDETDDSDSYDRIERSDCESPVSEILPTPSTGKSEDEAANCDADHEEEEETINTTTAALDLGVTQSDIETALEDDDDEVKAELDDVQPANVQPIDKQRGVHSIEDLIHGLALRFGASPSQAHSHDVPQHAIDEAAAKVFGVKVPVEKKPAREISIDGAKSIFEDLIKSAEQKGQLLEERIAKTHKPREKLWNSKLCMLFCFIITMGFWTGVYMSITFILQRGSQSQVCPELCADSLMQIALNENEAYKAQISALDVELKRVKEELQVAVSATNSPWSLQNFAGTMKQKVSGTLSNTFTLKLYTKTRDSLQKTIKNAAQKFKRGIFGKCKTIKFNTLSKFGIVREPLTICI